MPTYDPRVEARTTAEVITTSFSPPLRDDVAVHVTLTRSSRVAVEHVPAKRTALGLQVEPGFTVRLGEDVTAFMRDDQAWSLYDALSVALFGAREAS